MHYTQLGVEGVWGGGEQVSERATPRVVFYPIVLFLYTCLIGRWVCQGPARRPSEAYGWGRVCEQGWGGRRNSGMAWGGEGSGERPRGGARVGTGPGKQWGERRG